MTEINNCGPDPVFNGPILQSVILPEQPTLRDRFAMAALTGILANNNTSAHAASSAYAFADAMMKERAK